MPHKKCKSGDSGREVSKELFYKKIKEADVGIVAVTNHNKFDKEQYDTFVEYCEEILIFPGIELDVIGDKSGEILHGHIIVICDPKDVSSFLKIVNEKCNCDPNSFEISINDFVTTFGSLKNSIIMCHYKKDKALSRKDIDYIEKSVNESNVVLLEPSNARKAGIIINSESSNSWFGSDHHDWNLYSTDENLKKLPECLFSINNFDSLINLLKKNTHSVLLKTFLNQKGPENYIIEPFNDLKLNINLFKDVNVIFGGKATGKTEILKEIEKKLIEAGKSTSSFYIEDKNLDLKKELDYSVSKEELMAFNNKNAKVEFNILKNWAWNGLPTLQEFFIAEKSAETNQIVNRIQIINSKFFEVLDEHELNPLKTKLDEDKTKIEKVLSMNKAKLSTDQINELENLLKILRNSLIEEYLSVFCIHHSKRLEKFTIDYFTKAISSQQGIAAAPTEFGLIKMYNDTKTIKNSINTILEDFEFSIQLPEIIIGELQAKGNVRRITNIGFSTQKASFWSKEFPLKHINPNCKKNDGNDLKKALNKVLSSKISVDYFSNIEDLKKKIVDLKCEDLSFFINYSNIYRCNNNDDYKPSNGEASILLVDKALNDKKCDAIILDEPDSGMGADYINDILIPRISSQAKKNKIIVISTHEPNIVVRTHAYMCIYREEFEPSKYKTYIGNAYEELMKNVLDENDTKIWTETCIDKCEGGLKAITERERTYGHY